MSFKGSPKLILLSILLLFWIISSALALPTNFDSTLSPVKRASAESSISTSEADENSQENQRNKRQLQETPITTTNNSSFSPRLGIPGLPDPATIIKIAEILKTVGEKVIPILVEGNSGTEIVAKRVSRELQFLQNFKKKIDNLTEQFKRQ